MGSYLQLLRASLLVRHISHRVVVTPRRQRSIKVAVHPTVANLAEEVARHVAVFFWGEDLSNGFIVEIYREEQRKKRKHCKLTDFWGCGSLPINILKSYCWWLRNPKANQRLDVLNSYEYWDIYASIQLVIARFLNHQQYGFTSKK